MVVQTVHLLLVFVIVLATMLCIFLLTNKVKKNPTTVMERGRDNGELVIGKKTVVVARLRHPVMETGRGIGEMVYS